MPAKRKPDKHDKRALKILRELWGDPCANRFDYINDFARAMRRIEKAAFQAGQQSFKRRATERAIRCSLRGPDVAMIHTLEIGEIE